jgi:DNA (cytosine-5)-methyltransferase 1
MTAARVAGAAVRVMNATLGLHRGNRRVYLQGLYLARAGFEAERLIEAEFGRGRVTLRLAESAGRKIASKGGGRVPVIDVNCRELAQALGDVHTVVVKVFSGEIVITPSVREEKRRSRCRNGKEGSVCAGVGLLTKAAQLAGFEPAWAVELDERYADIYASNFPDSTLFNMPLEEVCLADLTPVELVTLGLPCEGVSSSRRLDRVTGAKRDRALPPEAHPDAGVVVMFAAAVIEQMNPRLVVLEEGERWLQSASGFLMRYFLERLGYKVEARIIDAHDYGYVQSRTRTVLVAVGDDEAEIAWPAKRECVQTLADVLDDEQTVEGEWFTPESRPWPFRHAARQRERGNNFCPVMLTRESSKVGAIKKRYLAGQGDNPMLRDEAAGRYRWLTLAELRRLFTVPDDFELGTAKTVAGEGLGQGVIVDLFRRIIEAVAGKGGGAHAAREESPAGGQLAFSY